jgi:glycerol-3-phosphate acyltransferase PlsY
VGKRLGVLVLVCDAAKGAFPVALARAWYGASASLGAGRFGLAVVAAAAVLGHCFTPWLRFRGGKGVATSLGVFLVMDPAAVAISAAIFGASFGLTRVVAVGSLLGALALPFSVWFLGREPGSVGFAALLVVLVVALHRDNLRRLRIGAERRLD